MRALTGEQEQAVARREGSLLLAAGAGSGKTSVLVERFVRAVQEDGIAPSRILAITFTERAAAELAERVRARFLQLGERELARDTEAAPISTFHGFCASLLRTHPLLAGLDPDFTILDEGLSGRLRLLAFRGAARDFLDSEGEAAVELLAAYGIDRLRALIFGTYDELRSRGQSEPALPPARPRRPPELVRAVLKSALSELEAELAAAMPARPGKRLEQALAALGRADALLGRPDAAPVAVPRPGALAQLRIPATANGALSSPASEAYREALARYGEACADHHATRACELLEVLLRAFSAHYEQLKRRRGALDFDDLELGARGLLAEHDDVRRSWSERLELLMVDEFQDTNHRQLELLAMLDRGNLFTVGDELQSIYGFRHADVEIFRARRRALGEQGASLALARNFRARPPLIAAVNKIFAARLQDRYTPLQAGREQADGVAADGIAADGLAADPPAGVEPAIELLLTDRVGWEDAAGESAEPSAERSTRAELPATHAELPGHWRQAEAQLLAQRVAELVESGAARAGEVVILLRALGDLPLFERALKQRGLSTLAEVGSFWGHQQVGDLLSYLRTLANPLEELALYSTLASPLVGVSSDGLVLLSRAARAAGGDLWSTILRGDPSLHARLERRDSAALSDFGRRLLAERRAVPGAGAAQLLAGAIAATGYEDHVLRLDWPEQRLANIHKLLRVARRFEAQEGRDLRAFLDHVAHQQDFLESSEPQAPVAEGQSDAVRLMSIHASKGLEFPVVCVADLGRAGNLSVPDLLLDERRLGLRLVGLDGSEPVPALDFERLCEARRGAEADEEARIMYVAMTRARERLLLSGAVDFQRWPEARLGAPPIAWLGPALLAELPELLRAPAEHVGELELGGEESFAVRFLLNTPATVGEVLRLAEAPQVADGPPKLGDARGTGTILRRAAPEPTPAPFSDPAISLSYTALSELERCGYRYYLERVLGLPENRAARRSSGDAVARRPQQDEGAHAGAMQPGGRMLEGRARGILVHRLLESFDFVCPRQPTVEDVTRVARELGIRVPVAERTEIAELVGAAAATTLAERLGSAPRIRRELPFAFSVGPEQPLVSGVLDAVVRDLGGGLLIVDYKSDRVASAHGGRGAAAHGDRGAAAHGDLVPLASAEGAPVDLEALVEREYGIQRLIYALAGLHDGAQEVEVVHWFLERPEEWVTARFLAADRERLEAELGARVAQARARGFVVSEAPHRALCETCPGRAGMCSWEESQTMREQPRQLEVAVGDWI